MYMFKTTFFQRRKQVYQVCYCASLSQEIYTTARLLHHVNKKILFKQTLLPHENCIIAFVLNWSKTALNVHFSYSEKNAVANIEFKKTNEKHNIAKNMTI